ncbi:hypothetical protein [Rubricoccus marinus]|uniref:Uncharacterized protein n=1 Tax=Rubricoccus marinus TaxID=716817 RepID=A0A259U185_9BACT|nr:hypothetical protein [Rubricoccus marinus]OZC03752.1 hypothetical protein BSZ36_12620 [Rubricoccus marinus]
MRAALALAIVLTLAACTSSKQATSDGYRVSQEENGDVTIEVPPGASAETLMAALQDAAELTKWVPPEAAGGLRQIDASELPPVGGMGKTSVYEYGLQDGRFSLYVYRFGADADSQIEGTQVALATLVEQGRIDAFELKEQSAREVAWDDTEATLHRVRFVETIRGAPFDSYMYLLKDDIHWIKARVSFPEGLHDKAKVDAMVLALLAG